MKNDKACCAECEALQTDNAEERLRKEKGLRMKEKMAARKCRSLQLVLNNLSYPKSHEKDVVCLENRKYIQNSKGDSKLMQVGSPTTTMIDHFFFRFLA